MPLTRKNYFASVAVIVWIQVSNETEIAVIEGKWFKDQNISVMGLFDLVSDINFDSPHNYHYEMFPNGKALQEIMERLASKNNIHHIYIAAHGSENGLFGSNGEKISKTIIKNSIKKINGSPWETEIYLFWEL